AGHARPDQLVADLREHELLSEQAAPVAKLSADVAELKKRYADATAELLDLMIRAGRTPVRGLITPRLARRFRDGVSRYLEARQRLGALQSRCEAAVKELADLVQEIERLRGEVSSMLGSALGAGSGRDDLDSALADFEDAAARKERYEHLTREIL